MINACGKPRTTYRHTTEISAWFESQQEAKKMVLLMVSWDQKQHLWNGRKSVTLCSAHKTRNYFVGFLGRSSGRSESFRNREPEAEYIPFHLSGKAPWDSQILHRFLPSILNVRRNVRSCCSPLERSCCVCITAVNSSWYKTKMKTKC